ncbi:MAG: Na/Pi cotransporter family protein [Treponemataceae bacterium]|nr:Na/Pi cotransporter family protein [Treponemataceae bacterium]
MAIVQAVLLFLGSLGFLLYGMRLMSDGVQKSAGEKLQYALGRMTDSRFMGLLTGLVITMLIQSSGATTVMVVSFVNAGLLSLAQSVGVIFGANIGTTITAWIVSLFGFNFNISNFAVPVFGVGFFLTFLKAQQCKNIGEAVMGFGLLFLGLGGLKEAFSFDPADLRFFQTIQNLGVLSILIGFVTGILITMLMHSSSAFTTIVIAMAFNNVVTWEVAAAMTLGSDIGSTIDAVLASIGASANARRAAVIHVAFNVFGTALALVFFRPLLALVSFMTPGDNIAIRISMLHTVFKTLTTLVLLPLVDQIVRLSKIIIKDGKREDLKFYHLDFQESTVGKESAAMHIVRVEKEIADMTDVVTTMLDRLQSGFMNRSQPFIDEHIAPLESAEDYCDQMHEQLVRYIINCEHLPVTENQRSNLSVMVQITDYLEAMTDECYAAAILLQRSIEKKMKFPQEDMDRFIPYVELARQFLQFIRININKHLDAVKLEFATELEDQIDLYRKNLKKVARKRLEGGANVKAELLYLDLVRQIEKIGDHAFSISGLLAQIV